MLTIARAVETLYPFVGRFVAVGLRAVGTYFKAKKKNNNNTSSGTATMLVWHVSPGLVLTWQGDTYSRNCTINFVAIKWNIYIHRIESTGSMRLIMCT